MAALLVVDATPQDTPGAGRVVDLRVDRSDDPLGELRRLLEVSEAYTHSGYAVEALASGDLDTALTTVDHALAQLPDEQSLRLVRASVLLARGDISQARHELQGLTAARSSWETIIRGFAAQGLLTVPTSTTLDELLKGGWLTVTLLIMSGTLVGYAAAPPTNKTSPPNATGWSNSAWTPSGCISTTA
ncbi:tetratricopeptide repeat protein [Salinifilum ghardaiensis]